jgi:flagellar hook-associated protein 3 FlgL
MLNNSMLRNLSQSYSRLGKYQNQLSTGKKVQLPSDDPVVAMQGISYRTALVEVKQFQRNLGAVNNWVEGSDSALDHAGQILHRGRELVVQLSNGSYSEDEKETIVSEIEQLKQDLMTTANTQLSGKYIFNGESTMRPPVTEVDGKAVVENHTGDIEIEVSKGIEIKVNINPDNVFGQEIFDMFEDLKTSLKNNAHESEIATYLTKFDTHQDNLIKERADLGARGNRFELIEARLGQLEISTSRMLSDNEDIDIEKVITDLKSQESVHRAALGVGSRIIQPSLMDFLR